MTANDTKDSSTLLETFCGIQGMMTRSAGASFIATLRHQAAAGIAGPCIEFGVYKGRSAFLLDALRRDGETLDLVDVHITPEVGERFGDVRGVTIHEMTSASFHARLERDAHARRYRVIHVDGNHTFDNVAEDLRFAEQFLASDGICILDDYQNPHFPQVPAATFRHVYTTSSRLRLFSIGANKAFLCDQSAHESWIRYMLENFTSDMGAMGEHIALSKTDINKHFDVVSFTNTAADETRYYGQRLYSDYYDLSLRRELREAAHATFLGRCRLHAKLWLRRRLRTCAVLGRQ